MGSEYRCEYRCLRRLEEDAGPLGACITYHWELPDVGAGIEVGSSGAEERAPKPLQLPN